MGENVKEAKREYWRRYRKKNREKLNAYHRNWNKENPEKMRQYRRNYWEKKAAEAAGAGEAE